jgi:hypothetical protein
LIKHPDLKTLKPLPAPYSLLPTFTKTLFQQTLFNWLNICGGDLPHHYAGVSKKNGKRIRLPLDDYDPKGDYF